MKKYGVSILILLVFLLISTVMVSNALIGQLDHEKTIMIVMSDTAIMSVYYLMFIFMMIPFYFMLTIFLRYVQNTLSSSNLYRLIRQSTMRKAKGEVVITALLASVFYISFKFLIPNVLQGSFTINGKIVLQALLQIEIVGIILILSAFLLGKGGIGIASFSGVMIYIVRSLVDRFLVSNEMLRFVWGSLLFIKDSSSGIEVSEANAGINLFLYGFLFLGLSWVFYTRTTDVLLDTQKGEQR
ncbi:hypothetical protein [Guggenheimella bovis]